ncbi:Protein bric-a-brac 1 [Eumeta japonica]|uniref:Protein bric-a-brac 1 n=1 Tax=Eumeta variegata TaxID=151549 RepID=A0A4C1ZWL9_EUMVA|nr:Protein bric-a-brac 1 [Eumeta japonica]
MALAPQQFCVRWNSYHTNLQAVFPRLLSTEHFADVTLACESRQLRCHKLVLSACSAYFERLLVHNPCKHPIVFMKDMRFSEMQALVDFMYKGEVNVTQDELPSLLKSAEALQIRGLCSGDTSGMSSDASAGAKQSDVTKDYTVATEALLAQAQRDVGVANAAGRPVTVVTEENVRKIEKLVLTDQRIKLWQIAEELQISKERVGEIIHEHMNMRKISARWVPKMLTPFDKQRRLQTSKDFLDKSPVDPWGSTWTTLGITVYIIDEICDRIVTVDETWVRQYDPESKQESMQWTKKGERPPKKFKVLKSASKLMATIFWDSEGVLLIDYLPKETTMNGQYYANLLAQARKAVVQKRRGKLSRGVLFLQDNASVHTARASRQALKDTGISEIDHPPHSPDLAPSDYFLFSNLKKELPSSAPPKTANGTATKKRKSEERESSTRSGSGTAAANSDVKEETVEEDGLYYGELDHDNMEFNEMCVQTLSLKYMIEQFQDDESGKPGSSLSQPSARSQYIRVKPESELFFTNKNQNISKTDADYIAKLSKMNTAELQNEFRKYGFSTAHLEEFYSKMNLLKNPTQPTENDYYKSWLEQNGELEVSLLKANDKKRSRLAEQMNQSEVELIPKNPKTTESNSNMKLPEVKNQLRRRGRPPIFKDRNIDIGDTVLKSDLDQFLEGKEVSSSGLSRKDLERVMMGKFNPNRRYSNEAMWAALMDVKKGGSIYRAAQTHKVPRKSLRNWMKRCHIKSSFPMPQQLKQFVENSKKQKEYKAYDVQNMAYDSGNFEPKNMETEPTEEFGKHFLFNSSNTVSSEDEVRKNETEQAFLDNDEKLENTIPIDDDGINPSTQE